MILFIIVGFVAAFVVGCVVGALAMMAGIMDSHESTVTDRPLYPAPTPAPAPPPKDPQTIFHHQV